MEYDENVCVWLVDVSTKERIPLEHGMLLRVAFDTPAEEDTGGEEHHSG